MRFLLVGLSMVVFSMTLWSDTLATLSDTIEKARSQSVLTQKMLADYIMIGVNNKFQNTEKNLQKNVEIFEQNIEDLDAYATSKKAFKNIEKITQLWKPIKTLLLGEKSPQKALVLLDKLDGMLELTRETTALYTRQTGSMLGKIIDASVEIGVHVQRTATLYLLKSWDIKEGKIKTGMKHSMEIISKSLEMLKNTKVNNDEIRKQIAKIEKDFMYFSVMDKLKSMAIPTLIYKKSDTILETANTISSLYNKAITLN